MAGDEWWVCTSIEGRSDAPFTSVQVRGCSFLLYIGVLSRRDNLTALETAIGFRRVPERDPTPVVVTQRELSSKRVGVYCCVRVLAMWSRPRRCVFGGGVLSNMNDSRCRLSWCIEISPTRRALGSGLVLVDDAALTMRVMARIFCARLLVQ